MANLGYAVMYVKYFSTKGGVTHSPFLVKLDMTKLKKISLTEKQKFNGILLPKLFWPTVRKNCSSDRVNLVKFDAENLQNFWDH